MLMSKNVHNFQYYFINYRQSFQKQNLFNHLFHLIFTKLQLHSTIILITLLYKFIRYISKDQLVSYKSSSQDFKQSLFINHNKKYQLMTGRQRTIPVNLKHQAEIQTDVNLINTQIEIDQSLIQTSRFRFQHLLPQREYASLGEDVTLFEVLQAIRELHKGGSHPAHYEKRIQLLEKNIEGILKRNLLIYDYQTQKNGQDYYSLLSKKEKLLLEQEFKNQSFTDKLMRQDQRIKQLEDEIVKLRFTLKSFQNIHTETQIYRDLFLNLDSMLKDNKKNNRDLQTFIQQKIAPSVHTTSEFIKAIGKKFQSSKFELKGIVLAWIRDIQTLIIQDKWNIQNLQTKAQNFMMGLKNTKTNEQLELNRRLKQNYEKLSANHSNFISVIKQKIQNAEQKDYDTIIHELKKYLQTITFEGVKLQSFKDILFIGNLESKTIQVPVQDIRTKHMISILASQFQILMKKYPKINDELPEGLKEILTLQVLEQFIQTDSLDKIRQILVYKNQVIKVQDIYQYSRQEDKKVIGCLRVLLKSLLEELQRLKKKGSVIMLDEGILEMLRVQSLLGLDVERMLALYRPQPKIVAVDVIAERIVYQNGYLQKGVPVAVEKVLPVQKTVHQMVQYVRQVPIRVEVPVWVKEIVNNFIVVRDQKVVVVPQMVHVVEERLIQNTVTQEVIREKVSPILEQKIIPVQIQKNVVVQQVVIQQRDKVLQVVKPIYQTINLKEQVPIYLTKTLQIQKQIEIKVEVPLQIIKYVEIQKQVPHIIDHYKIQYLEKQVPVYLHTIQEKIVEVPITVTNHVKDVIHEVEIRQQTVTLEKQLIRQVPKQILIQTTHFVKGDVVQVLREVQTVSQKPIIYQKLITKDKIIQKLVPLYIKQQKIIQVEVKTPFAIIQPKIIYVDVVKPIIIREQVIKEVKVQVPVPIIIQKQFIKEVVRVEQKVVEKYVEVPRVVEIEKIVEKIVVVPRIIDRMVTVPYFIQKIVPIQQPILQIVEVPRQVLSVRDFQKVQIVEVIKKQLVQIQKPVQVDRQKIVQIRIQTDRMVEVEKNITLPVEVIRQMPVNVYKDRIIQKVVQIHEVTMKERRVEVPITFQKPVQMIHQKIIQTKNWIINKEIQNYPQQKLVSITTTVQTPKQVQLKVQVPVWQTKVQKVVEEKIVYQPEYKTVQLYRDKVVKLIQKIPQPSVHYLTRQILNHEIHEKGIPIHVNVPYPQVKLMSIEKPQHYIHYKEVAVSVPYLQNYQSRTITQSIKQVHLRDQKVVSFQTTVEPNYPQPIEIKPQIIVEQVPKKVVQQIVVTNVSNVFVNVPSPPVLIENYKQTIQIVEHQRIVEKIVEKVVMLPQIVEIVRTIHEITQRQSVGVASNISIEAHRLNYIETASQLKRGLQELLVSFKNNRQSQVRSLLTVIEKFLPVIDTFIVLPKIIQVPKQVQITVYKDRPILIPVPNKQKQAALGALIEKLVGQISRLSRQLNINLESHLDQGLKVLFFQEISGDTQLNEKLKKYIERSKKIHQSLGPWATQNFSIANSFLQDRFTFSSMIEEFTHVKRLMDEEIKKYKKRIDQTTRGITSLICDKKKVLSDYKDLVNFLSKARLNDEQQIREVLRDHMQVLTQQYMPHTSVFENIDLMNSHVYRSSLNVQMVESNIKSDDPEVQRIIVQMGELEREKNSIEKKYLNLQSQFKSSQDEFNRRTMQFQKQTQNIKDQAHRQTINFSQKFERMLREKEGVQQTSQKSLAESEKKQIQSQFQQRIHQIEQRHRIQIDNLRKENQKLLSTSPPRKQTENIQSIKQKRQMEETIKRLQRQIQSLRRQSIAEQSERFASMTSQVATKKFQRQPRQFKTPGVEEHEHLQVQRRQEEEEVRSSSSKQSSPAFEGTWKSSMTLKVFMEHQPAEDLVTIVMHKVISATQEELDKGTINSYSPQNIYLKSFNINNLDLLSVKFGAPILNKKNRKDGCYIAPEVHQNQPNSQKSIVWTLGVIWDELIHRDLFFKSIAEVQDNEIQYEVRNTKLSPILKNNLIDMLEKDPTKRIDLFQAKKRLSLQTYLSGKPR